MAKKKAVHLPIYTESFDYAYAHDECLRYNASHDVNVRCNEAIESAIASHHHDYSLDCKSAVREVVKQFGYERMFYVLTNTVQEMDWDGRISHDNKDWAQTFPTSDKRPFIIITHNHPGLVNMFVTEAKHNYLLPQPLKAQEVTAEAEKFCPSSKTSVSQTTPAGSSSWYRYP